jgi:hypothetical protein
MTGCLKRSHDWDITLLCGEYVEKYYHHLESADTFRTRDT